jgi:hypothetical protein
MANRTGPGSTTVTRRPVWTCPKYGARLISKNLWHSCGNFTIEDLFAGARPEAGRWEVGSL